MMLQVIGPVERQAGEDGICAEPASHAVVQPTVGEQQAVSGIVHQDGEPELTSADHHHRQQERKGIGPPREQRHAAGDQRPGVQNQQGAHEVRLAAELLDLLGCQIVADFGNSRAHATLRTKNWARVSALSTPPASSYLGNGMQSRTVRTDVLDVAYEEHGPPGGAAVVLLHGFPYDVRCFDEVAPALAADGCRVLVPYLRGYGPTRFLNAATPRSGEQAALGHDLLQFMDALGLGRAALAGYDWGGRAACIVAALWPERVRCLLSCTGYNIQNIARSGEPVAAEQEHRFWYQYYFHTERGRAGLTKDRRDICRLLWKLWSPEWRFDEATFEKSAVSFDNPDFVDVVIQSYRHRYGYAPGDPALAGIEQRLAAQPTIAAPTINLHGGHDGVGPAPQSDGNGPRRSSTSSCRKRRPSSVS